MDKTEFRAVIKHFHIDGKKPKEIKQELDRVHGESAPSFKTVCFWVNEFKRGRRSTEDESRSGRPKEATTDEMIAKVHDLVLNDRRLKVPVIADTIGISKERVGKILHEDLHMRKLSAIWVPRLLTEDQKRIRVTTSEYCLGLFNRNRTEFLRRFITVDETWIHHYTPETKIQSKQWVEAGCSAPKKAKVVPSANKIMATVFWDARGVIFIDYLQKGKTITGQYYASLLDQLNEKLKENRPHLARKKVLFHHDNAPSHTSAIATAKLVELRFEILRHAPYSPDLAPSDFISFPNLKNWLGGKRFFSNEEVIAETNAYFEAFDSTYYSDGIKRLEYRWSKCIELKGDYIEK